MPALHGGTLKLHLVSLNGLSGTIGGIEDSYVFRTDVFRTDVFTSSDILNFNVIKRGRKLESKISAVLNVLSSIVESMYHLAGMRSCII